MFIDYQDPRSVYEQIVDHYEKMILHGVMEKDEKLPSVRQLAAELSINPNTIQKALTILEKTGFIYSVRGKGNFVADCSALTDKRKVDWLEQVEALLRDGKALGVAREQVEQIVLRTFGAEDKNMSSTSHSKDERKDLQTSYDDVRFENNEITARGGETRD